MPDPRARVGIWNTAAKSHDMLVHVERDRPGWDLGVDQRTRHLYRDVTIGKPKVPGCGRNAQR